MLITKFQSFSCPLFPCILTAHRKLKLRIKYRLCLKLQQSCSFVTLLNGWWPPLFSFHRALNFLIFCILTKKKKTEKTCMWEVTNFSPFLLSSLTMEVFFEYTWTCKNKFVFLSRPIIPQGINLHVLYNKEKTTLVENLYL